MSQYPSPYQPPQPPGPPLGYDPYGSSPLQPARRASVLLYITGALGLISAVCCIGGGAVVPRMLAEKPEVFRDLQQQVPGITPEMLRNALFVFGGLVALVAVALMVLAPLVRGGSKGAIIGSMVLGIAGALFLLAQIGGAFLHPSAQSAMGGCMFAVPLALFVALVVCLIQALGASGQVEAMRNQYAQQYWQSAYQQQMYRQGQGQSQGQAGGMPGAIPPHGGFPPPPTPPPPPPPPPPQQPPRGPDDGPSATG